MNENHSPPTRHSQNPYDIKPVLPPHIPIRPSQTKAVEIIDTAATNQETNKEEVKIQRKLYPKLIESPVNPSSDLGALSRKC